MRFVKSIPQLLVRVFGQTSDMKRACNRQAIQEKGPNMNVNVTEAAEGRSWFIEFNDKTAKGETLKVELTRSQADPKDKQALPYMAKKNGWSDKMLSSWWSVQTYTTDENGTWGERYNPTHKRESYERIENGKAETY